MKCGMFCIKVGLLLTIQWIRLSDRLHGGHKEMTKFDEHKLEGIAKRSQYKPYIHYDVEAGRWYASYKGWRAHGETPKDAFDGVLEREKQIGK